MLQTHRLLTIALVFLAAAAFATGAAAQDAPGPIEQYVEQVPTAKGERPVIGKGGTISKPLPPSVQKKLGARKGDGSSTGEQRDAEDQVLGLVGGSENFGATRDGVAAKPKPGTQAGAKDSPAGDAPPPGSNPAGPTASATPSGDDANAMGTGRIAAIVAILLAISASALVAARWRGRSRA